MRKLYIIGAGGFGREVEYLVHCINESLDLKTYAYDETSYQVVAFVDQLLDDPNYKSATIPCNLTVISGSEFIGILKSKRVFVSIAVGNSMARHKILSGLTPSPCGLEFPALIHPSVGYDKRKGRVFVGVGSIICSGVSLTTDIYIGYHVHINLNSTIGHDSRIGDFSTLSPGVHISGGVKIGEGAFLGTGAVVLPRLEIGAWANVGAGAVVTKDVPAGATVVGIPAKPK